MTNPKPISGLEREQIAEDEYPLRFVVNHPSGPSPCQSMIFAAYEARLQQLEDQAPIIRALCKVKPFSRFWHGLYEHEMDEVISAVAAALNGEPE